MRRRLTVTFVGRGWAQQLVGFLALDARRHQFNVVHSWAPQRGSLLFTTTGQGAAELVAIVALRLPVVQMCIISQTWNPSGMYHGVVALVRGPPCAVLVKWPFIVLVSFMVDFAGLPAGRPAGVCSAPFAVVLQRLQLAR